GNHIFNSSASSTYKAWNKLFYISYGDGSNANGTFANDTVTIAGISVQQQSFAIVATAHNFNGDQADGLMGLGYQNIAAGQENPVIWSMYLAGELTQPIFSFWFGPISTGSDTGELILGGYDTTKYTGAFTYSPVKLKGYWEFAMDSVSLSFSSATITTIATSVSAILDTGTTMIVVPTTYANAINTLVGGAYDTTNNQSAM
ncbi:unnamed protein product, partial [Didymodactylos carnosus]